MKPLLFLLFLIFAIGFACMPREECRADPVAMRCETVSLINAGTLAIPNDIAAQGGERGQVFWDNTARHKWYSKYGPLNGWMFIPPLLAEKLIYGELPYLSAHRLIFLNLYNLFLSLATAAYLYFTLRYYTRSTVIIFLYILGAFYCTYWWNYLRIQNSEIYQTLFLLAFYYHLSSYFKAGLAPTHLKHVRRDLLLAGAFLGALIAVKLVYIVTLPAVLAVILAYEYRRTPSLAAMRRPLLWLMPPLALALAFAMTVNAYKFGDPFESGYSQWQQRGQPIFSGNFLSGLRGFLFDPQFSIFIHFPLLLFAIFGFRSFAVRFPFDTLLFSLIAATMLLLQSKLLNWQGFWCYGPRYLLPVLPLLSLPFVQTLEFLASHWRSWWVLGCSGAMALVMLYSFQLQLAVNTLPFFVFYDLQTLFVQAHNPTVDAYFTTRPFGTINNDVIAYKQGRPWEPVELVAPDLPPQNLAHLQAVIEKMTFSNYYFWPTRFDPAP